MAKSLSVLFAGEVESDTQLILRALKKGGYKPAFEQVKTAAQLRKALKKGGWEVVISAYNLPKLDGPTALKILQESRVNIPFIVVSDDLDEEAAVEMLKCGSYDCISKDNLNRLVPVVERELKRASERQQGQELEAALRESEDKFKYIFDHSTIGKSITLVSGEIEVNRALCRMLGYSQKEINNRTWQEITHPDDVELTQNEINKLLSGEKRLVRFSKRYIHKNGSVVWAEVGVALRRDGNGQPLYYISSITDITERIHAEDSLRNLSSRQEAILVAVPDILMEVNNDKFYTWANRAGLEFFGKDVIGKSADDYFEGEQDIFKEVAPLFQGKKDVVYVESWQRRKDGEKRLLAWWCRVLKDKGGNVTGALSSAHDITASKTAEESLRASEERFRIWIENSTDLVTVIGVDGKIQYESPSVEHLLGYKPKDLIGKNGFDLIHPDDRERVIKIFNQNIQKPESLTSIELRFSHHDGSWRVLEVLGKPYVDEHGQVAALVNSRDISERKQAQTLQEAVYRIAAAAETTGSLDDLYPQIHQIISSVMPAQYFYITLYDEAQNLLRFPYFRDAEDEPFVGGIQPAKGLSAYVLRTGKSLLCTQEMHDELERRGEVKLLGVASAIWLGVPLIVEGKTIGAMVLQHYTDPMAYGEREQHMLEFVSTQVAIAINRLQAEQEIRSLNTELEKRVVERTRELRLAQDKIVRQEKLALLGQLAGGVGHELRNPLGIISNAIYYLKYIQPDADEKVKQYHAMIDQEVRNSDKIITDLLDFARLEAVDREPVSVRELVQRTLTRFPVPESIQTTLKISEDLPKVFADMAQMEQVLGNLTVNACQAMVSPRSPEGVAVRGTTPLDSTKPGGKGGELTITAHRHEEMVAIAVKDSGVGITPENMAKIFEPLFTTKSKGIGLGLAVSRKLTEANGGRIEVKSELGKGSTFTLILPVEGK